MLIKIQVISETENGQLLVEEIASLSRAELRPETLGLSLTEAKEIVAGIQKTVATQQVPEHIEKQRH